MAESEKPRNPLPDAEGVNSELAQTREMLRELKNKVDKLKADVRRTQFGTAGDVDKPAETEIGGPPEP